jgi:hypothetical protein
MTMPAVEQMSFFDPCFLCPDLLDEGTLSWLLTEHSSMVLPEGLRLSWERPGLVGRDPWPFRVVAVTTLLRYAEEGVSRRGAARRLKTDAEWRAAAGLDWKERTLDESELRRFERFLAGRDEETGARRVFVWLGHVVDQCIRHGVIGDQTVWVADSTLMFCYGAILDTIRFLGDECRSLAAYWAKLQRTTVEALAEEWGHPLLTARSTKGHFTATDWSSPEERADAVTQVAETALEVVQRVRHGLLDVSSPGKRKRLARRCRNIVRKIDQDLEADEQGRLVVARRVVEERLVSRTDPEARHGRKTKKKTFNGFKLHVFGDAISGLVASVCVTPATTHDGAVAHRLLGRAKALHEDIQQVLGDTHYGSVRLRKVVRETLGIDLVGKPQALPRRKNDRFRKEDFEVDFEAMTTTCPAGVATSRWTWSWSNDHGMHAPRFHWSTEHCDSCPVSSRCLSGRRKSRSLRLHPYEEELREQRNRWLEDDVRSAYRQRSQGERLIHTMTRHGCRKARAWGLQAAQVQAHMVAIMSNLKLLAARKWELDDGG